MGIVAYRYTVTVEKEEESSSSRDAREARGREGARQPERSSVVDGLTD